MRGRSEKTTPEERQRGESRKKLSHNRRNMNKRYLNTNECLKIHKKRKNDILWKHKKASLHTKKILKQKSGENTYRADEKKGARRKKKRIVKDTT
jgi:hypothetical protein